MQPGFHAVAGSVFYALIDGCSSTNAIENNPPVSISQKVVNEENTTGLSGESIVDKKEFIKIFPNPTTGMFTIDGNFQNASIQIYTADGRVYRNLSQQHSPLQIDISHLPPGLYFIRAYTGGDKVLVERIVKQD